MAPLSHSHTPLHLYRRLLREASYLPIFLAPYVRQQITTRFHKHIRDAPSTPITTGRLRTAHHHLRFLRAANAGVLANMTRIVHLATGRLGRRRRMLLAQQFFDNNNNNTIKSSNTTSDRPTTISARHKNPQREPDWLDAWDLPKLDALATSQSRHAFTPLRAEIKANRLAPTTSHIPTENSMGRPLGTKAARGKLRKWYKSLIHRLMAPLPREEWEQLGRLARGEDAAGRTVPARRKLCGGVDGEKAKTPWDWKAYAVEPVRSLERGQSRSWKARTGEEGEAPYGTGRAIGLHRYERARLWTRLYMRVWEATPTMEEVVERRAGKGGSEWRVEWGKQVKAVPVATPAQMDFFRDAPEEGGVKRRKGQLRAKHLKG